MIEEPEVAAVEEVGEFAEELQPIKERRKIDDKMSATNFFTKVLRRFFC
jgi:hypothetical protein